MAYNLTDTQKNALRWIVERIRAGDLSEDEVWFAWSKTGTSLLGYRGECPEINRSSLDALASNGLLLCDRRQHDYKCALTAAAYSAVDTDFGAPDLSFTAQLDPSWVNLEALDPEIRQRCLYSLSAGGKEPAAWDKAVRTALVILEERLRRVGGIDEIDPHATGVRIVNLIFSKDGQIVSKLGEKRSSALRDLYAGTMLVFRNRYGHRLVDPTPADGGAIILLVNLLLKMLDDIQPDS